MDAQSWLTGSPRSRACRTQSAAEAAARRPRGPPDGRTAVTPQHFQAFRTPNRDSASASPTLINRIRHHEAICYLASVNVAGTAAKGLSVLGFSALEKADPAVRAAALERAALAVARLDATLDGHPLLPAWQHWVRLEAVRAHAGLDGHRVDPQRLAAFIEGLRLRAPDTPAHHERGADLDALSHALRLYGLMLAAGDHRPERDLDDTT